LNRWEHGLCEIYFETFGLHGMGMVWREETAEWLDGVVHDIQKEQPRCHGASRVAAGTRALTIQVAWRPEYGVQ
jgi:hypothetical protein